MDPSWNVIVYYGGTKLSLHAFAYNEEGSAIPFVESCGVPAGSLASVAAPLQCRGRFLPAVSFYGWQL